MTRVELVGVSAECYRLISEHHDEVTRELKLLDPQTSSGELSTRLIELAPLLGSSFKALVRPLRTAMAEARQGDASTATVELSLEPEDVRALRSLHELLCLADDAARAGDLLALPLDPGAVDLRAWIVDEAERQVVAGEAPRPWGGPAA